MSKLRIHGFTVSLDRYGNGTTGVDDDCAVRGTESIGAWILHFSISLSKTSAWRAPCALNSLVRSTTSLGEETVAKTSTPMTPIATTV